MQYTIRRISEALDRAIRRRARDENRSLNDVALDALTRGLGLGKENAVVRNLDDITGTWKKDRAIDAALEAQDQVDESLWT